MKKIYLLPIVAVLAVMLSGCSKKLGMEFNYITSFNLATTTTSAITEKLVLPANEARTYAIITNDSDTVIYLNQSDVSASSTIDKFSIRLNANGGTYEITDKNLYVGNVYASSSVAGKNILVLEK
jgi:hypothetical protein